MIVMLNVLGADRGREMVLIEWSAVRNDSLMVTISLAASVELLAPASPTKVLYLLSRCLLFFRRDHLTDSQFRKDIKVRLHASYSRPFAGATAE